MEREYGFWMKYRAATVRVDGDKKVEKMSSSGAGRVLGTGEYETELHTLNHYDSFIDEPRAEMYRTDLLEENAEHGGRGVVATCESGWDFSSRWKTSNFALPSDPLSVGRNGKKLQDTFETPYIFPVDLNAVLHRVEIFLFKNTKAPKYARA